MTKVGGQTATAAIGKFPYAHPTLEGMATVASLMAIGSPDTAAHFHGAAIREAIDAVRPARAALARGVTAVGLTPDWSAATS